MDPQALWEEICHAAKAEEWQVLIDKCDALLEWLKQGGTPPVVAKRVNLAMQDIAATGMAQRLRKKAVEALRKQDPGEHAGC